VKKGRRKTLEVPLARLYKAWEIIDEARVFLHRNAPADELEKWLKEEGWKGISKAAWILYELIPEEAFDEKYRTGYDEKDIVKYFRTTKSKEEYEAEVAKWLEENPRYSRENIILDDYHLEKTSEYRSFVVHNFPLDTTD
jgi:hypothetical protein